MTSNVYEFEWLIKGDSKSRTRPNEGKIRFLASNFDEAYVMLKAESKKTFPNINSWDFEVTKSSMVVSDVRIWLGHHEDSR